jgi:hypothetical protein
MPTGATTSVSGFWSTGPASDRGIGLLHHGATVSDPAVGVLVEPDYGPGPWAS